MSSALLGGYKAANSVDCLIFSNEKWYFGRDISYQGEGFTEVSGIIVEYVLFSTNAIFLRAVASKSAVDVCFFTSAASF